MIHDKEPHLPAFGDTSLPPFGEYGWWWRLAYGGSILVPYYGLTGQALRHIGEIAGMGPAWNLAQLVPGAVGAVGGYYMFERRRRLSRLGARPALLIPKRKVITICGMEFEEWHLYHNLLVFGGIGAGKTSGALDWGTEQMFQTFNEPGNELGAFVLDVKGNRTSRILKFAHDAGRDVIKRCKIIRPNCSLPYAKFEEPETGRLFFVPAVGYSTGSEAGRLLAGMKNPDTGELIPADIFAWTYSQLEVFEPMLRRLEFDLTQKNIWLCGWRRDRDELVRVNHSVGPWQKTEYKTVNGQEVRIPYPKKLKYVGMGYIDNGLRWNVVNNTIDAAEAARRLRLVGQLLNNGKTGGDNKFWDDGAENHVVYCIEFLKLVHDLGVQVDGPDIARLTSQRSFFAEKKKTLDAKIEEIKKRLLEKKEPEIESELTARLKKCTDVLSYFQEEWNVMEGKTKTIMQQVVKQFFNALMLDYKLQQSFCSKATYSFITAISLGDIFIFGGCEYETLAKFLGTALKLDFQSTVLARPRMKHLNQERPILMENDEAPEFAVAGTGSGVGDDRTMSIGRESKLINFLVAQTMAQLETVLGKEGARTYVGACGGIISFQISDYPTAETIAKLMPEVSREQRRLSGNDYRATLLLDQHEKVREVTDYKREPRFTPNDFMTLNLADWEAIAYNKAQTGDLAKVVRQNNKPHPIGSPKGKAELEAFMRWYECASLEELAWDLNKGALFDPFIPSKQTELTPKTPTADHEKKNEEPFVPSAIPTKTIDAKLSPEIKQQIKDARSAGDPAGKTVTPESQPPSAEKSSHQEKTKGEGTGAQQEAAKKPADAPRDDTITNADLTRIKQLYKDPAVTAELARKLIANLDLDLNSNYPEFIEKKASAETPADRSPELGPRGMETGNPTATGVTPAPAPDAQAAENRRRSLAEKMAELEARQAKASGARMIMPSPDVIAEIAQKAKPDKDMLKRLEEERI